MGAWGLGSNSSFLSIPRLFEEESISAIAGGQVLGRNALECYDWPKDWLAYRDSSVDLHSSGRSALVLGIKAADCPITLGLDIFSAFEL